MAPPQSDNQISAFSDSDRLMPGQSEKFDVIEGEYIVIFKNQFDSVFSDQVARRVSEVRQELQNKYQISDQSIFSRWQRTTKGFAAKLDSNQVDKLKNDPRVARVKPNIYYRITSNEIYNSEFIPEDTRKFSRDISSNQVIPWGVERVNGPYNASGKTAWIMDSGIDLDHPDLNVDLSRSISFIDGVGPEDFNGHGTAVAGILAAIDNNTDVAGVAAGAMVVSVKVCQNAFPFPLCPKSSVLSGIEFVSSNALNHDIVNFSIGSTPDPDLDNAVLTAAQSGIRFAIGAGNDSQDATMFLLQELII